MSVINESLAGDELICISEFSGPPQGEHRRPANSRTFHVGERVKYVSFYRDANLHDNPVCWMVVFDASDGKRYAATQTLFVTEEIWQDLQQHFVRTARKSPKAKPAKSRPRATQPD